MVVRSTPRGRFVRSTRCKGVVAGSLGCCGLEECGDALLAACFGAIVGEQLVHLVDCRLQLDGPQAGSPKHAGAGCAPRLCLRSHVFPQNRFCFPPFVSHRTFFTPLLSPLPCISLPGTHCSAASPAASSAARSAVLTSPCTAEGRGGVLHARVAVQHGWRATSHGGGT